MRELKVSIVVSTYNRPDALNSVLNSILNQTNLPNEIIIADDGSSNETRELVDQFMIHSKITIRHVWHEDKGFRLSEIRNKAIVSAKGDYIIQIDGDTVLHPKFVRDHMLVAKQGCFVAGSRAMLDNNQTEQMLLAPQKGNNPQILNCKTLRVFWLMKFLSLRSISSLSYKNIKGCNMAFWKKDFIAVNGYNEDFIGWGSEDKELETRLLNYGLSRLNLKFGAIQYHLHHHENCKARTFRNEYIAQLAKQKKLLKCLNGIDKYQINQTQLT